MTTTLTQVSLTQPLVEILVRFGDEGSELIGLFQIGEAVGRRSRQCVADDLQSFDSAFNSF